MQNIKISQIQSLFSEGKIVWTEHVSLRLRERKIKRNDLLECIKNGEIIEQYPDDTPFPSCLLLGNCTGGHPLHVVIGLNTGILCCIITAYRPDSDKWDESYKTRRSEK